MSEKPWTFPCEWIGDKEQISGIGIFQLKDEKIRIQLQNLNDFLQVCSVIEAAFQMGRDSAKSGQVGTIPMIKTETR